METLAFITKAPQTLMVCAVKFENRNVFHSKTRKYAYCPDFKPVASSLGAQVWF